ncbi:MAG: dihydrodipicolinate synthase family protein [Verrucomicrobia bacterium]|nr:dihydrodipicolinate synthase family protein [Verrucomicrobiota bacterium]MBV8486580.1 dihydrodipicolinate synthase family protein [Verrucomicrobiota bacterium]
MSSPSITLPTETGSTESYQLREPAQFEVQRNPKCRSVFAAAHVVADPLAENCLGASPVIDWEATLRYRQHLWSFGLGVAEAMDTAQRGMGLDWAATKELIRRSAQDAKTGGFPIVCGAGTDQLPADQRHSLKTIVEAYLEQCAWIEQHGARIVIMASRALAAAAHSPDDYHRVYETLLDQTQERVILHWLGPLFDPALSGYWGSQDLDSATTHFLSLLRKLQNKVEGVKVSLLDKDREIALRRELPGNIKLFTGDDFNYPELILGDEQGFSHALLGIFDGIAPATSAALAALDRGDKSSFLALLNSTVPLARHIFQAPTYYYKTGLIFLAYLNGHQSHFRMIGGLESARSVPHLVKLFKLADQAGLLQHSAAERMQRFLNLAGVRK